MRKIIDNKNTISKIHCKWAHCGQIAITLKEETHFRQGREGWVRSIC
jgi:hypothetical protein